MLNSVVDEPQDAGALPDTDTDAGVGAAEQGLTVDLVWQGLETLLRHILSSTERMQWDLATLAEQKPAQPDVTTQLEEMHALLRSEAQEMQAWQQQKLDGLRSEIEELSVMTEALVDSTLDAGPPAQDQPPPPAPQEMPRLEQAFHAFAAPTIATLTAHQVQLDRMATMLELALRQRQPAVAAAPPTDPALMSRIEGLERANAAILARLDDVAQQNTRLADLTQSLADRPAETPTPPVTGIDPVLMRLGDLVKKIDARLHVLPNTLDANDQDKMRLTPWDNSAQLAEVITRLKRLDSRMDSRLDAPPASAPTATLSQAAGMPDLRMLLAEILAFQQRHDAMTSGS